MIAVAINFSRWNGTVIRNLHRRIINNDSWGSWSSKSTALSSKQLGNKETVVKINSNIFFDTDVSWKIAVNNQRQRVNWWFRVPPKNQLVVIVAEALVM